MSRWTPPKLDCKYGAPMGRYAKRSRQEALNSCRLFKIKLDSGGYDTGGAYWGIGNPIWVCLDSDGIEIGYTRAATRKQALQKLLGINHNIKLKRPEK